MARTYLGGSGQALTIWISVAASTVLVFYGYDQVCTLVCAPSPSTRIGVSPRFMLNQGRLRQYPHQ